MTIDSEDRPIQIVCSLLSFYGQCYIQNKKRVKPSNRIDLFYWDHLYLSRFSITTLVILGWNGWNYPNIHSVYAISCCFVVSKLVVPSHNVYLSLHFVVCGKTKYHKIISSLLLLLSLITRCCPLWKTTIDLFSYHLLLHVVVVNTQNIDLALSAVLLFCLRWAISIVYPYLKSLSCCCLW